MFVRPEACDGYEPSTGLPIDLRTGPRVLRAYRADGSMNYDANVVVADGDDIEAPLTAMLSRTDVVEVHARALEPQCFTFAVLSSTA